MISNFGECEIVCTLNHPLTLKVHELEKKKSNGYILRPMQFEFELVNYKCE